MEQETFIPGMNDALHNDVYSNPANRGVGQDNSANDGRGRERALGGEDGSTPVVGFLYSVSKNGFPEYWPLYVGQNRIGKSSDMDIVLREGSVSDHHADIQIKKMRSNGGRLIATIVDAGSKNGIVLNNEELDYDRHALKNGDLITIGLNYLMAFILVDPIEFGLSVSEDFVPLEEAPAVAAPVNVAYGNPYDNVAPIQDETINFQGGNGGASGLNAGGTRIM